MSQTCQCPWQLCTRTWKPRMCDDFSTRYFDIDALSIGQFISFPDEVRLPNTTRLIDIVHRREPSSGMPHSGSVPGFNDGTTSVHINLIRPDEPLFEQVVMLPTSILDFWRNGLAQDPPNGLGNDVKSIARDTNCYAREVRIYTIRWTTPLDLDEKGIYQFRLRANISDFETTSEPFRLSNTTDGLEKIRHLQSQGLALAKGPQKKSTHAAIGIVLGVVSALILVLIVWYAYGKYRRVRAARRTKQLVELEFQDDTDLDEDE